MTAPTEPAAELHDPAPVAVFGPVRLGLLLLWAGVSFGSCYFARDLQALLQERMQAYGLAAQGILIAFILLVLFNAWYFNRQQPEREPAADQSV